MTAQDIIDRNLNGMVLAKRRYHRPPGQDLDQWYCYVKDFGHCIMVLCRDNYREGMSLDEAADLMVPAPVKTVLRRHAAHDGIIVIDAPNVEQVITPEPPKPYYSSLIGLVCDDSDYEIDGKTGVAGGFLSRIQPAIFSQAITGI